MRILTTAAYHGARPVRPRPTPLYLHVVFQSMWSAYTVYFLAGRVQMYLANFSGVVIAITYLVRAGGGGPGAWDALLPSVAVTRL